MAGDDEPGKAEKSLRKFSEQQLLESGQFVRELDERVHFERVNDRIDSITNALDRYSTRVDKMEDKFETRLNSVTEKVAANTNEIEKALTALQLSVTRHEAQIKVLMDLRESNWTTTFLTIIENKQVRAGMLLIGGWIASQLGPEILKTLLKILQQ